MRGRCRWYDQDAGVIRVLHFRCSCSHGNHPSLAVRAVRGDVNVWVIHSFRNFQSNDNTEACCFDTQKKGERDMRFAIFGSENPRGWPPICGYAGCGISFYITGTEAVAGNQKHILHLERNESTSTQLMTQVWLIEAASALEVWIHVPLIWRRRREVFHYEPKKKHGHDVGSQRVQQVLLASRCVPLGYVVTHCFPHPGPFSFGRRRL